MKPRSHSRWPTALLVVLQAWFAVGMMKTAVLGDLVLHVVGGLLGCVLCVPGRE